MKTVIEGLLAEYDMSDSAFAKDLREALAEQPTQQEPVRCPQTIIDAITAYGDARADQDANNAPTTSHERLADCIRLIRKMAEQPAQQPVMQQPRVRMSKDYRRLFEILCAGEVAIGLVNYHHGLPDGTPPMRDVCKITRRAAYDIWFFARGIGYGGIDLWHADKGDEQQLFLNKCKFHDLEFVDLEPAQQEPAPLTDTELINRGCHYKTEMMQPAQQKPLTEPQKQALAENWFSEDWAITKAIGMMYDHERLLGIKENT